MSQIGIALTVLMMLLLVALMAPRVFLMNRGKTLRNIAIWLAIFAGLGLVYKIMHSRPGTFISSTLLSSSGSELEDTKSHTTNDGKEGFRPPSEE